MPVSTPSRRFAVLPSDGPNAVRAAVYCRISSDPEGRRAGVKRQEQDCRELCDRRGWQVVGSAYVDNDMSAYSGKPRPEYLRLLDDVKNGVVDAVVAWHPDRMHRSPRELEDFIDLVEATGVRVATVQSGDYDLATSSGRMNARIIGTVARKEAEATSERTRRAHRDLAKQGKDSGGGTRPYGFHGGCCPDRDCRSPVEHAEARARVEVEDDGGPCCDGGCSRSDVREEEAAIVREVAERLLAGASLSALARELTEREVPTVTGAPWAPRVLRRMVRSARMAGLRVHRGEVVGEAEWPAIIEQDTWTRLRRFLDDPARKTTQPARTYVLAGMVRCSRCGTLMGAKPARGRRNYHCARRPDIGGCGRRDAVAEPLERWVVEAVLTALEGEGFGEVVAAEVGEDCESEVAAAVRELSEVEERMERLRADHYVDGVLGREEFLKVHGQLEGKREQVRRRVAELTGRRRFGQVPDGEDLREWWEEAAFDRRRAILAELIDHVTIGDPVTVGRSSFDPRRVSITWRT